MLAQSTVCHLCGHGGADSVDHLTPLWLLKQLGADPEDPTNLAPAHGVEPCPTCRVRCNLVKGGSLAPRRRVTSRTW